MRRNTTTIYLPEDLYFRIRVAAGWMRAERVTLGLGSLNPDESPSERMVQVSGTVVRVDHGGLGSNERRGLIRVAKLPPEVAVHIVGTLA